MKMNIVVYVSRCKVTKKLYFGVTSAVLRRRVNNHFSKAQRNPETRFHRALRKYGRANFGWHPLKTVGSWDRARWLERALIRVLDTTNPRYGYNTTEGGEGVAGPRVHRKSQKGRVFSEEHLQRLREARRRRLPVTPETREKMRKARLGKPMDFSEEALKRISQANKGKRRSAEIRARMRGPRESLRGVPRPEWVRRKISESHRARRGF